MVFEDEFADLFDLVGFGFAAFGLDVDDFFHAVQVVDEVAALSLAGSKPGAFEDMAQVGEGEIRIGASFEYFGGDFLGAAHGWASQLRAACATGAARSSARVSKL